MPTYTRQKGDTGKQGRAPVPSKRQFLNAITRCDGYPHAKRNKALLVTAFGLGLRPKELSSLKLKDVYNFDTDSILSELTLLKSYTKRAKVRQLPLNNNLLEEHLKAYITQRKDKGGRNFDEDAPLFLSQRGTAFSPNSLGNLMNEMLEKRAKIVRACSYSGRRFFATNLLKNGADINTVRILMGHESLATTQRYLEGDPEIMAAAINKVI